MYIRHFTDVTIVVVVVVATTTAIISPPPSPPDHYYQGNRSEFYEIVQIFPVPIKILDIYRIDRNFSKI